MKTYEKLIGIEQENVVEETFKEGILEADLKYQKCIKRSGDYVKKSCTYL